MTDWDEPPKHKDEIQLRIRYKGVESVAIISKDALMFTDTPSRWVGAIVLEAITRIFDSVRKKRSRNEVSLGRRKR